MASLAKPDPRDAADAADCIVRAAGHLHSAALLLNRVPGYFIPDIADVGRSVSLDRAAEHERIGRGIGAEHGVGARA